MAIVFRCLTCSTFDDVTYDVILRNVGGLLADVIPLNLTDRCSAVNGGGREGGSEGGGGWREGGNPSEAG